MCRWRMIFWREDRIHTHQKSIKSSLWMYMGKYGYYGYRIYIKTQSLWESNLVRGVEMREIPECYQTRIYVSTLTSRTTKPLFTFVHGGQPQFLLGIMCVLYQRQEEEDKVSQREYYKRHNMTAYTYVCGWVPLKVAQGTEGFPRERARGGSRGELWERTENIGVLSQCDGINGWRDERGGWVCIFPLLCFATGRVAHLFAAAGWPLCEVLSICPISSRGNGVGGFDFDGMVACKGS